MVLGAELQKASPAETPMLISQLIDNLNYRLEHAKEKEDKLKAVLYTHIQFERIQPFSDVNGRTGQMIMNYSLLQEEFPTIKKETFIHIKSGIKISFFS